MLRRHVADVSAWLERREKLKERVTSLTDLLNSRFGHELFRVDETEDKKIVDKVINECALIISLLGPDKIFPVEVTEMQRRGDEIETRIDRLESDLVGYITRVKALQLDQLVKMKYGAEMMGVMTKGGERPDLREISNLTGMFDFIKKMFPEEIKGRPKVQMALPAKIDEEEEDGDNG